MISLARFRANPGGQDDGARGNELTAKLNPRAADRRLETTAAWLGSPEAWFGVCGFGMLAIDEDLTR